MNLKKVYKIGFEICVISTIIYGITAVISLVTGYIHKIKGAGIIFFVFLMLALLFYALANIFHYNYKSLKTKEF